MVVSGFEAVIRICLDERPPRSKIYLVVTRNKAWNLALAAR